MKLNVLLRRKEGRKSYITELRPIWVSPRHACCVRPIPTTKRNMRHRVAEFCLFQYPNTMVAQQVVAGYKLRAQGCATGVAGSSRSAQALGRLAAKRIATLVTFKQVTSVTGVSSWTLVPYAWRNAECPCARTFFSLWCHHRVAHCSLMYVFMNE